MKLTLPKFKEQFFWKDCSIKHLRRHLDSNLVDQIETLIQQELANPKRYITIDVGYQQFKEGTKTCRDTGWHVDGINNDYLMYIDGDFRTEFAVADLTSYPEERSKLREFNESIAKTDFPGIQVAASTVVKYTSKDIHRGRVATGAGERFFLRVCSSDYLYPKNKRLS